MDVRHMCQVLEITARAVASICGGKDDDRQDGIERLEL